MAVIMATSLSAGEVDQQYIDEMGPELGPIFARFWNECVHLHWKWEEVVALFGTNPERVALLNKAAKSFFRVIQDTLWEDVLLHIARLTDPPQTMGKDNLTLQRLPALVDPTIRAEVTVLLEACLTKSGFARDWRKRHIAHGDLRLALRDKAAQPLAPASRRDVKDVLAAIAALLNRIELHYKDSEVQYELHPLGNAEALLYVLRDGIEAEEERMERIKSGKYTRKDLERRPI